jgi:hypothetical protein
MSTLIRKFRVAFAALFVSFAGVLCAQQSLSPIVLKIANVSVLTGSTGDIGTVDIPAWVTRFTLDGGGAGPMSSPSVFIVTETATGDISASNFVLRDGPGGTGQAVSGTIVARAFAGQVNYAASYWAMPGGVISTGTTLYLNQTVCSANAGTVSVYVKILPLP